MNKVPGDHDSFNIFPNMIDFMMDFMTNSRAKSRIYFETDKHHQMDLSNK